MNTMLKTMSNKQNLTPVQKQGILYEIKTSKNSGVYLSKDITHDNYKSLSLLTKQARLAHKSYVQTLETSCKKTKSKQQRLNKLSDVESFNHTYDFCEKNIKQMLQSSKQCGVSIKQLSIDLTKLKDNINNQTSQLQNASLPVLKKMSEKFKKGKTEQKAITSKMNKQFQETGSCFALVRSGIKECDRRMEVSQFIYGSQFGEQ